jgi:4-diphosphocytidyl-2-C-methyl-D-erythritol kinase
MDISVPQPLVERAPAKINLTLRIRGRRSDGYHALESLVAFAGASDTLRLEPGPSLQLRLDGPTAGLAGEGGDNLVIKAARLLAERIEGLRVGSFSLTKRLPVAAGIGGGSSDAAAALRLLARLNDLPLSHPAIQEAARLTGADVPVCLEPRARMMRGFGEELGPPLHLPPLFCVLVNPRVPVETAAVFRQLGLEPGQTLGGAAHPDIGATQPRAFLESLDATRNDLEAPALALQPIIGEVLARLRSTSGLRLARMSGSGATVFGLYDDCRAAVAAAKVIRRSASAWWVKPTILR